MSVGCHPVVPCPLLCVTSLLCGLGCVFDQISSVLGQISSDPPQSPMGKKKRDSKKEARKERKKLSVSRGKAGSRISLAAVNTPNEPKPEELKPE